MKRAKRIEKTMKKNQEENSDFRYWFRTNWIAAGGLMSKASAARLLNKSKSRITQMIAEGKLFEHKFSEGLSYIEAPQVFKIMHQEEYKMLKNTLFEDAKGIPENQRQSYINSMLPILERQEKCIEPTVKKPKK